MFAPLFRRQAEMMRRHLDPDAQLLLWLLIFDLCFPLYALAFVFPGSWMTKFIYWLSVAALHLTAMTGVTAAETLIAAKDTDSDGTDDPEHSTARAQPDTLA